MDLFYLLGIVFCVFICFGPIMISVGGFISEIVKRLKGGD